MASPNKGDIYMSMRFIKQYNDWAFTSLQEPKTTMATTTMKLREQRILFYEDTMNHTRISFIP